MCGKSKKQWNDELADKIRELETLLNSLSNGDYSVAQTQQTYAGQIRELVLKKDYQIISNDQFEKEITEKAEAIKKAISLLSINLDKTF